MTRADLPPNPEMDEHRESVRQAILEYLENKTGRAERISIVKEAINEWLNEKYVLLGKWTLGGLIATAVAVIGYLALIEAGWHK